MNVVICWSDISGYMAACWRELSRRDGVKLFVTAFRSESPGADIAFGTELMSGIDCRLLDTAERENAELIRSIVVAQKPDVVVIVGWFHAAYRALLDAPELKSRNVKFVMTMDTPWRGTLRQRLAPLKIGGYVKRMDGVVVAGERAWQYARRLGVPESRILRGVYGFDAAPLRDVFDQRVERSRESGGWPRKFLYVGRYVEDKAIDILLDGYARYRASVGASEAWPLTCCGRGQFASRVSSAPGVTDRGFVQPGDLPAVFRDHGALLLPSRFEPWGVIVAEALCSGLPVICSEATGASVELVRHLYNGLLVPTEDAQALANAMRWSHEHPNELSEMGRRATTSADAFAAEFWAKRWQEMLAHLVSKRC